MSHSEDIHAEERAVIRGDAGNHLAAAAAAYRAERDRRRPLRLIESTPADGPPPPTECPESATAAYGVEEALPSEGRRFKPTAIDDVEPASEPAWLIHRLLPARGLACVVGPPKSGKSFLTSDMLFAVARGAPYGNRATLPGPVFYLTGEGVSGFKRRLVALRRHYEAEGAGLPFYMIENVPDLGSDQTDLADLLREIDAEIAGRGLPQPRAVVLDTLARCMGDGDENAAKDMGRFVSRCGSIERRYGCLVVAVHHMGKNLAAGARGSNALNGAADVTLMVEKGEAQSTVRVEEMKDGPEGQEWRFRLVPYDVSETSPHPSETTTETTTCVVELLSEPTQTKPRETKARKVPRGVAGDLLKVIRRAIEDAGESNVVSLQVPNNVRAVSRANLKTYCKTLAWQDPEGKADSFRAMFSKHLSTLRAHDAIGFDTEWVWLT